MKQKQNCFKSASRFKDVFPKNLFINVDKVARVGTKQAEEATSKLWVEVEDKKICMK